jgi:8-oxo-dGTP pyrophosphatase MutT (NUDIX family)
LDGNDTNFSPDETFLDGVARRLRPIQGWGDFRRGARAAAVTALLYRREGTWHLLFVRRRADLPDHPGQVALPGGGVRPGEDAWAGALRELAEEVGVTPDQVRPLGAGTPIYTAVSNYSVVPFVAWLPDLAPVFVAEERELDGVLEIPLQTLLDEKAWLTAADPRWGRYLPWEESIVWGLTGRILEELLSVFRQSLHDAAGAAT